MVLGTIKRALGGDYNEKELRKLRPIALQVNEWTEEMADLSDADMRAKTDEFRGRLSEGETLDDILPEAFALVREVSERRIGLRHFDVQILGGIVLHKGKISEMKTGEGKTLVATLPLYLNALEGKGAHLITVNDYLAKRDAQWMGPIYHSLGLSVGVLQHDSAYLFDPDANLDNPSLRYLTPVPRREAYRADITYGTNNEFGFDYLRDNMVVDLSRTSQRPDTPQHYAIVDEVDNILVDEARTPLIISGPAEETEEIYRTFSKIVPRLSPETDFVVDVKHRSVSLTDDGASKVEKALGIRNLYDAANFRLTRFLDAALRASLLYQRDHHYVVKDGEVIIVDEFTGRLMHGRRWSDGLHQAVEAQEGVRIQRESITYATITLQNYFRMYEKLAGMTGTAWTEREEFHTIYGLDVLVVDTHRPMIREDESDIIFRSDDGKYRAVVEEISEMHAVGRPTLVGTVSIENSEKLAEVLKRQSKCEMEECGEYHKVCPLKEPQVLNAKHHEREATIIAQAGRFGAVTIATNMAGRGTDIVLGGNPELLAEELARKRNVDLVAASPQEARKIRDEARERWQTDHDNVVRVYRKHEVVVEVENPKGQLSLQDAKKIKPDAALGDVISVEIPGGLHIVGTERHEARRIDNQLRGRAGRQGDPGSSRFFVSFDDEVMRRFVPDRIVSVLGHMGMDEDTPLVSGMLSNAIEQAQTKVEGYNFDIRKHVVQYDDVMNRHRALIYAERRKILEGADIRANVVDMITEEVESAFAAFAVGERAEEWDMGALLAELSTIVPLPAHFTERHFSEMGQEEMMEEVLTFVGEAYEAKEEELGEEKMRTLERLVMLGTIDRLWVYHLTALDEMRQGIGLSGYGGRDPLVEFKREAHDMWEQLAEHIRRNVVRRIFHTTLVPQAAAPQPPSGQMQESGPAK
ncbi:MAG: preprotein translocase subunit SecA, partial [Chloroflexi bacterium]|nr:preprotein translocase subunit SecA [Chloroflexota bacterium]